MINDSTLARTWQKIRQALSFGTPGGDDYHISLDSLSALSDSERRVVQRLPKGTQKDAIQVFRLARQVSEQARIVNIFQDGE